MLVTAMETEYKMTSKLFSPALAAVLLTVVLAGPAWADDSVCAIKTADGGLDFYGLLTSAPEEARRSAVSKLVHSQGMTRHQANQMIVECIPPGGAFSDENVQAVWTEFPR